MAHTNGTQYAPDTLNGIIRMNDRNLAEFEYSELVQPTAFFKRLPWVTASNGTQHKFTVVKSAAGAAFRAIGEGVVNASAQELTRSLDLKYIDFSWHEDVASVDGKINKGAYMEKKTMRSLNAGLAAVEAQIIKGTDSSKGFDGLQQLANLYDGNSINVGGSGGTRVYMMIVGVEDVAGIIGNNGNMTYSEPSIAPFVTSIETGATRNDYNVAAGGYLGLQVAGKYSVAFAYNIDGTTGKGVTDALLSQLFAKFPSDRLPFINCILMSMKGLGQLQASRTATNPTGAPAPFPASWDAAGRAIPIVVSDAVNDSESTVTTTTTTTAATTTTTTAG